MITQINKLKRFGIYQNYTWGAIDDFKKKNLVYGWNYSGKTTLSKLFQVLEFKDKNRCFGGSEIEITINNGTTTQAYNQDTINSFPFVVKVFNSDYIKRIFTWDEPTSGFNPISFYLGDTAGNLKDKIKKLTTINERLLLLREKKYKPIIDLFESYNKANGHFSRKSKEVRENYLPGLFDPTTFDKSHLKRIVDAVKDDLEKYILSASERDLTKIEATTEKKFDVQNENLEIQESLEKISLTVKLILEDSAPKAISFPTLEEDTVLFDWVQKGIPLHKDSTECKFCTKQLPENRIDDLNSFYSKKLKEIQDAIEEVIKMIDTERNVIEVNLPIKKDIAEPFQSEYELAINAYETQKGIYKEKLSILEKDIKSKGSNIFISIKATDIEIISLTSLLNTIQAIIKRHNKWLSEFGERKSDAIKKILKHYVAEYLKSENYNKKETDKDSATKIIETIEAKINANMPLIKNYNEQLSSTSKGQGELNDILEILLHRDDIKIELKEEKFTLERSGHAAEHLSEGEKSAIAFAYFLTELKALRKDDPSKLPNTIIFIDDPISSLDSNHIFQVRSLLKDFFKIDDFAQLFVSTHNFEFFSMLMDCEELFKQQKKTKADFYFIKRNDSGQSNIEHLPTTFKDYNSEYVSIFHILNEFNKLPDKSTFPHTILLPNAMRRFLELYTAMKYPSSKSVDSRVKAVFTSADGTYHRVKLLHWFSHQNQFEKVQQHDDKLLQIEEAIKDLMEHIEINDELHWKGLNGL
ncbi:AAA family ATPase [Chryseobacterium nepalense]|uniref:AAA family ATPase n=1 Tax=Chryseobacterium nepalense TaxID=1854498 RepID=UPI002E025B30|nr:wobble nucleotide-excising tRNase [Chryseobacterium nepalense]